MQKRFDLGHLGIAVGILYWPAEALLHSLIFGNNHFTDSLLRPDANELWMRSLISFLFIAFGLYAQRTVHHQQQLQKHLSSEKERLLQIIDSSYDAYVSIDQHSIITGWNHSAEKLFGWPKQRIIGKKLDTTIPKPMRNDHHNGMRHYQHNSIGPWLYKPVQTHALSRDGSKLSIELVVTPITSNGMQEFFAFIREVKKPTS